jgi:hypothetical protein
VSNDERAAELLAAIQEMSLPERERAGIKLLSPEQAQSDSGLAALGPLKVGTFRILEGIDSPELEEFKRAFADKMSEVCKACERLEQELDKLLEALEPR